MNDIVKYTAMFYAAVAALYAAREFGIFELINALCA